MAATTESTYEAQIRKDCKSLLFSLSNKPTMLPVRFRHLLDKPPHFTTNATPRALQSWLTRVKLGLQTAKDGALRSTSDIRNWFGSRNEIVKNDDTEEQEIIFFSISPTLSPIPDSSPTATICTVPYLPYVPYQTPDPIHTSTLNPSLPSSSLFRDI